MEAPIQTAQTAAQRSISDSQKIVGGYLRISRIAFPPECQAPEEKIAYVDTLRQVRKAELERDAAQQGQTIAQWYDDLGVSGRGEFIARRLSFARARRDAKEGRLHVLYARDLSRLFRNVVQQELWFAEMEDLGVTVHAQDLPFAADPATRILLRQQLGIVHEYVSSRMGTLSRERMRSRILSGAGLGLHVSQWGLLYSKDRKAFEFDPATSDRVVLVYETYIACSGSLNKTARELNLMLSLGHPRATATPHGNLWSSRSVESLVGSQTYRRIIRYGEVCIPAPERIPEVVPPSLTAQADEFFLPRAVFYKGVYDKRRSRKPRFTYTNLLRCGYCGGIFSPMPYHHGSARDAPHGENTPHGENAPHGEDAPHGENAPFVRLLLPVEDMQASWIAFRCQTATSGGSCSVRWSVQQNRLHVLIGAGLKQAFQDYGIMLPQNGSLTPEGGPPCPAEPAPGLAEPAPGPAEPAPAARGAASSAENGVPPAGKKVPEVDSPEVDSPEVDSPEVDSEEQFRVRLDALTAANLVVNKTVVSASQETLNAATDLARTEALIALEAKRARYLELYAGGLIRDEEELKRFLAQVDQERLAVTQPRLYERVTSTTATRLATIPEVRKFQEVFQEVWPADWNLLLDHRKHDLLKSLRALIFVRILPYQSRRGHQEGYQESRPSKTGRRRRTGGRLTLTLELPALGMVGIKALHLAETDAQLDDYWKWRTLSNPERQQSYAAGSHAAGSHAAGSHAAGSPEVVSPEVVSPEVVSPEVVRAGTEEQGEPREHKLKRKLQP